MKKIGYIFGMLGLFGTLINIFYGIALEEFHILYGVTFLIWITAIITNVFFILMIIDIDRLLKGKSK